MDSFVSSRSSLSTIYRRRKGVTPVFTNCPRTSWLFVTIAMNSGTIFGRSIRRDLEDNIRFSFIFLSLDLRDRKLLLLHYDRIWCLDAWWRQMLRILRFSVRRCVIRNRGRAGFWSFNGIPVENSTCVLETESELVKNEGRTGNSTRPLWSQAGSRPNSLQSTCSKRRAERCPSVFVRFRFTFPLLLEAGAFLSYCVSDKLAKECTKVNWARARDRDHD